MDTTNDLKRLPALLRAAAGTARHLSAAPPARITVRETARWLGVSPPTAARVLAGNQELQATGLVSITALANLATPLAENVASRVRVAIVDSHAGTGALRVAAGLAQGLGIMGCQTRLLDDKRSSFLREHFGGVWPGALLSTDLQAAKPYAIVWIASEPSHVRDAALVLVPCPVTPRGLRDAAEATAGLLHEVSAGCLVRLLPWGNALDMPEIMEHAWSMFSATELHCGTMWLPLSTPPACVPPRQALALRVAIAALTQATLRTAAELRTACPQRECETRS